MTKELARYFLVVIDRDLHFSFNGIGLPNNACEWLENQLMQENFDKVEEFIKLKSKSGLNVKYGITSEGVIDVGYTGSIAVKLYNHSGMDYTVRRGDKISQLVVVKIDTPELVPVVKLADTERGTGGFGSTGR